MIQLLNKGNIKSKNKKYSKVFNKILHDIGELSKIAVENEDILTFSSVFSIHNGDGNHKFLTGRSYIYGYERILLDDLYITKELINQESKNGFVNI